MIPTLRPYQVDWLERLRAEFAAGKRRVLGVMPTGSGKTVSFAHMTASAAQRGKRVCILVHRRELLHQTSDALRLFRVHHGTIMAGRQRSPWPVQVASVQTLARRLPAAITSQPGAQISGTRYAPTRSASHDFDFLIVDEAHHAVAGQWAKILAAFPNAAVLGVTATPSRLDGRGLGDTFESLVLGPSIGDLIRDGFLAKPRVFAPNVALDLSGIRTKLGDYEHTALDELMQGSRIVGDAVEHYKRLCDGKPAIAVCVSIRHAELVAEKFRAAGYRSHSVDGATPWPERKARIRGLASGEIQVLTSCELISEGLDVPAVTAAILLRPTQSLVLAMQQVGRALRPAPGKDAAIILDHAGNTLRHGLPDEDRVWTLDAAKRSARKSAGETGPRARQCEQCWGMSLATAPHCLLCGANWPYAGREVEQVDGELAEIDRAAVLAASSYGSGDLNVKQAYMQQERRRRERQQQGRAQTVEELIELGKTRKYRNPSAWARNVLRARGQRA